MRLRIICDLVRHARHERERAAILEFRLKLARNAQENVTLDAPMIGEIARRVLDHANTNGAKLLGTPKS